VRLATTWQTSTSRRKSSPVAEGAEKIAPMGVARHVIGTTVMDLTRQWVSAPRTCARRVVDGVGDEPVCRVDGALELRVAVEVTT